VLARLRHLNKLHDVLPFREHAVRNGLFAKFVTIIQELIETKPLLTDQLCSVCEKYVWVIPLGADDLRINALHEEHAKFKGDASLGESGIGPQYLGYWDSAENVPAKLKQLADSLSSGSLFQLLTRPKCRVCMLVVHLLSLLLTKSFLSWALGQPLPILHGFQCSMQYSWAKRS
jgi:hypothetical protein